MATDTPKTTVYSSDTSGGGSGNGSQAAPPKRLEEHGGLAVPSLGRDSNLFQFADGTVIDMRGVHAINQPYFTDDTRGGKAGYAWWVVLRDLHAQNMTLPIVRVHEEGAVFQCKEGRIKASAVYGELLSCWSLCRK